MRVADETRWRGQFCVATAVVVVLFWAFSWLVDEPVRPGITALAAAAVAVPTLLVTTLAGGLLDATIGDWLEESIAVWELMGARPRIVIGSSMGGWIALLLARHLAQQRRARDLAGLVLIAPAFDMTETLMWRELPQAAKDEIARTGVTYVPSAYADPYPITKHLIEEGRSHLLEGRPFDPGCPVRILQGMRDADVPWRHSLALVDLLASADVELTLIKDGDHRLSAPHDLQRLTATIATLSGLPE